MSINKQRDNSGVLFRHDRKESDSHPDYRGEINVGGVEYQLSGWIKQGPKAKFMSLSVRPKNNNTSDKAAPRPDPLDDAVWQ